MDEKTQQDDAENDPTQAEGEQAKEFDPQEIENDPARNPPIDELNDLKGG